MTQIIVVDDQATNRRVLKKLASTVEPGAHVSAFGNPLDALAFATAHPPDLLITDYKMMPFDGDELIRRFRRLQHCADVPTVVITSFEDTEFRDRAIEAGSTDFLLSPVNHKELVTRSRSLLSLREQRKERIEQTDDERTEMVSDMLQVVNSHLSSTLADLQFANRDFDTLAQLSPVAAVFVDSEMRVRRFTSAVTSVLNLRASDLGRALTSVKFNLIYEELAEDFEHLRQTGELIERYISTKNAGRGLPRPPYSLSEPERNDRRRPHSHSHVSTSGKPGKDINGKAMGAGTTKASPTCRLPSLFAPRPHADALGK